jgi:hypothetical protein
MDRWQTYQFEFRGGLISNLSPLQHGLQAPGSARILRNFEPSIEGGYRRILGYVKYDSNTIPWAGKPVVQGSGQTGTTLVLAGVSAAPLAGSTIVVGGNTYTISTGGVVFDAPNKTLTLTLTSSLVSSPADGAVVTFANRTDVVSTGISAWDDTVIVARGSDLYRTTGAGYTQINVPAYGTVLVNGGSQTGTTLVVDGLTSTPQQYDTFTVAGIQKTYIITSAVSVTGGGATLSIYPALASSPADNAAITFTSTAFPTDSKTRFSKYKLNNTDKIAAVNGVSYPVIYDKVSAQKIVSSVDLLGVEHVAWFKNCLFFAKDETLIFTAPFTDNDTSAASGAGVINVGGKITALKVFREQLIIFCEQSIKRLVGNTAADYQLQPITENLGCAASDTVQEVGGDLMFLGPDGLRFLSATDRIGDFNLAVASKPIQRELVDLLDVFSSFTSVVIKSKSQYRLFGYSSSITQSSSKGILGTQLDQEGINWAELAGIKCYAADSDFYQQRELVVFANADGFVYKMEQGNTFDGTTIFSTFATPFVPLNDPRIRKTFYKLHLYIDPVGTTNITANVKLDLDDKDVLQPDSIQMSNTNESVAFYGATEARFGTSTYGGKLKTVYEKQIVGSGFLVSLQFVCDQITPPVVFDAATLEYASHDRR